MPSGCLGLTKTMPHQIFQASSGKFFLLPKLAFLLEGLLALPSPAVAPPHEQAVAANFLDPLVILLHLAPDLLQETAHHEWMLVAPWLANHHFGNGFSLSSLCSGFGIVLQSNRRRWAELFLSPLAKDLSLAGCMLAFLDNFCPFPNWPQERGVELWLAQRPGHC